jgi:hypothetical protein
MPLPEIESTADMSAVGVNSGLDDAQRRVRFTVRQQRTFAPIFTTAALCQPDVEVWSTAVRNLLRPDALHGRVNLKSLVQVWRIGDHALGLLAALI